MKLISFLSRGGAGKFYCGVLVGSFISPSERMLVSHQSSRCLCKLPKLLVFFQRVPVQKCVRRQELLL